MLDQNGRPSLKDFLPADAYEKQAPAFFDIPEVPVLYEYLETFGTELWLASNGFHVWEHNRLTTYELDEVQILPQLVVANEKRWSLSHDQSQKLERKLKRCLELFRKEDANDVELAIPADFETGEADDLGSPQLLCNLGEGHSSLSGNANAIKRQRSG